MTTAVYTVSEVAEMLGISKVLAYDLTKREDFPSINVGRRIVVPKTAFEAWLNAASNKGAEV
jgi:excisionase family DNA binding protein